VILAAGATGRLRPVVEELLARGHELRVTARDPEARSAHDLAGRGAEIVRADLDDQRSLVQAAEGVDAVFAAGSPHGAGPAGEIRQGINVAGAAVTAGVAHLVFSSGAGAERPTGVPVLDSKYAVEQRIRQLGIPHTILAPVYFMQNAFNPWNLAALAADLFPLALPPGRSLQQVAIEDLAALAADVLERPDEFANQRVEVAGDDLTGEQAAEALSRVTGRQFVFSQVPLERLPPGMRSLFEWLDRVCHHVERAELRRRFPRVEWHSFEDWAADQDWTASPVQRPRAVLTATGRRRAQRCSYAASGVSPTKCRGSVANRAAHSREQKWYSTPS
jgi:uncharacterized protein YbjT (DUF2867 family)